MSPGRSRLAQARSFLFVPGDRPDRFGKAVAAGADALVFDLEDSVPAARKGDARAAVGRHLAAPGGPGPALVVRINSPTSPEGAADLGWLAGLPAGPAIMVPKADGRPALEAVRARRPHADLLPLVESVAGYLSMAEIAATPGVVRLVLGHLDFMLDAGISCSDEQQELLPLRFAMAVQTRRHGLAAPVDGVTAAVDDPARLQADMQRAARMGFGAKLCIHPRQVPVLHAALRPPEEELAWAQRVMAANQAAGGSACQLDGQMIDAPVVLRAQRLLQRAG